jgi:hypothetical protein
VVRFRRETRSDFLFFFFSLFFYKKSERKKIFFRASFIIKTKKKNFSFSRFYWLSDTSHPVTAITAADGLKRAPPPRPNPGTVQTAGPHRPKATRPAV